LSRSLEPFFVTSVMTVTAKLSSPFSRRGLVILQDVTELFFLNSRVHQCLRSAIFGVGGVTLSRSSSQIDGIPFPFLLTSSSSAWSKMEVILDLPVFPPIPCSLYWSRSLDWVLMAFDPFSPLAVFPSKFSMSERPTRVRKGPAPSFFRTCRPETIGIRPAILLGPPFFRPIPAFAARQAATIHSLPPFKFPANPATPRPGESPTWPTMISEGRFGHALPGIPEEEVSLEDLRAGRQFSPLFFF